MSKKLAQLWFALMMMIAGAARVLAASELETRLTKYVNLAISLGRGIGILGAIAGAAGLIFSPNEEGKRKFKTALVGCVVLALAAVIVNTIWDTGR